MKPVFGVDIDAVSGLAKAVVTQPKAFYKQLEKHGGYIDPLKVYRRCVVVFADVFRLDSYAQIISQTGVIVPGTIAILFITLNLSGERTQRQNDAKLKENSIS